MGKILSWAKSNPWEAGGIAFLVVLILLYITGFFGGSNSSSSGTGEDANEAAFLNAEAAQGEAGDELQAVQDQDNASTAQALINAQANTSINQSWATAGTQDDLISELGSEANNLGTTLTNTTSNSSSWGFSNGSSSSGIFGLFGGSSSTNTGGSNSSSSSQQSFIGNSEQGEATGLLGQIEQSEFNAGT